MAKPKTRPKLRGVLKTAPVPERSADLVLNGKWEASSERYAAKVTHRCRLILGVLYSARVPGEYSRTSVTSRELTDYVNFKFEDIDRLAELGYIKLKKDGLLRVMTITAPGCKAYDVMYHATQALRQAHLHVVSKDLMDEA